TAVHALAVIAYLPERQATSDQIAASVATEASVVRRLLSGLREARLVRAAEGRDGGYRLARAAELITLQDIYEAVAPPSLFPVPDRLPNPGCPIGAGIHSVLDRPLAEASRALGQQLARTTLADVLRALTP
ncbi:MAG TPA: Rrf2 family transcriptional regulator, partial [Nevskiaceae bacterium]|nr:Rrf2 family transcriptional regulator [Nevskiaceae bacterium]